MNKKSPEPTTFVIFGGTGDLAWRKLVPSLFDLFVDGRMPGDFAVIAVGRRPMGRAELRERFLDGVRQFSRPGVFSAKAWSRFSSHLDYLQGDYSAPGTYTALAALCASLERSWRRRACRIFHMATPPFLFGVIPGMIACSGLNEDRGRTRLVVEKPIGHDLDSARRLNSRLVESFDEAQIFRIDHYLGKETVQNILAFRFANPLFEPIWNRHYIDSVTITVAETVGVGERGGFYDGAGALRDMVQNHLMQLLCLVAMEPINSFTAEEIRNRKVDVLRAVRPLTPSTVRAGSVRGQYGSGLVDGKRAPGYRSEAGVPTHSATETFAALKLHVDNWRWQDVPFYLRSGKRMARAFSEIAIQFRAAPHQSFPKEARRVWHPSRLVFSIQPDEGIVLGLLAKSPGPKMLLRPVQMKFSYKDSFAAPSPNAYEALLWDVMRNDATHFMRADQVEAAWRVLMPVLAAWGASKPRNFPNYAAGSPGPAAADVLMTRDGRAWAPPAALSDPKPGRFAEGAARCGVQVDGG